MFHPHHVLLRDTLSDTDNQTKPDIHCFEDCCRSERRWDKDDTGCCPGAVNGLASINMGNVSHIDQYGKRITHRSIREACHTFPVLICRNTCSQETTKIDIMISFAKTKQKNMPEIAKNCYIYKRNTTHITPIFLYQGMDG